MAYGSERARAFYARAPAWVRSVVATAYGWKTYRTRFGQHYISTRKALERSQYESTEALIERSSVGAQELALHAAKDNSAFARWWGPVDRPWSSRPLLSKSTLREAQESFRAIDRSRLGPLTTRRTSGTSGTPLELLQTVSSVQRENAFAWQHRSWHGCEHGCRTATIAGHPVIPTYQDRPPFWVTNWKENRRIFSSVHMSPAALPLYASALAEFEPELIHGYPSSIALVATAVLNGSFKVRPRAVITASETLLPHQRDLIRDAFGVNPHVWYGNTELAGNIVECPDGRLHVREDHSFVEFLDVDGAPALAGADVRLVATAIGNRASFLLRYDTADLITLSHESKCPCGRAGRLVTQVQGRVEDYVIDARGRLIGRLDHLFKDVRGVHAAQLVQEEPGALTIRVVLAELASGVDVERIVRSEALIRMAPETRIEIEFVPELERGRSGKTPFVISRCDSAIPLPLGRRERRSP